MFSKKKDGGMEEDQELINRRTCLKEFFTALDELNRGVKNFSSSLTSSMNSGRNLSSNLVNCGQIISRLDSHDAVATSFKVYGTTLLKLSNLFLDMAKDMLDALHGPLQTFLDTDVKDFNSAYSRFSSALNNLASHKSKCQKQVSKANVDPLRLMQADQQFVDARKSYSSSFEILSSIVADIEDSMQYNILLKFQTIMKHFYNNFMQAHGMLYELESYNSSIELYCYEQATASRNDKEGRAREKRKYETTRENNKYGSLLELLVSEDSILLDTIVDSLRSLTDEMLEKILRILDYHDLAMPIIKREISAEVSRTDDSSTLFRSNNLSTKLIAQYTRLVGRPYLMGTLKGVLLDVLSDDDMNFEIDPNRLTEDDDKDQNMSSLNEACQKVLDKVLGSLDSCPLPMREICNHLQNVVWDRFPDNRITVVGGYIFLRFFCPAIMSPISYEIVDSPLKKNKQRAMILLTKVMQNVANLREFGMKEKYMVHMNVFLLENLEKAKDFFSSLSLLDEIPNYTPLATEKEVRDELLPDIHHVFSENFEIMAKHILQRDTSASGRSYVAKLSRILAELDGFE